jgi:hypothetical protein
MPQKPQIDDIDLGLLVARVLRHKTLAVAVALVVLALAGAYAYLAQPFYKTTTKLVYQSAAKAQGGNLGALASLAGISLGGASSDPSAYLEDILKSADFLTPFIDRKWGISTDILPDTNATYSLNQIWKLRPDTLKNPNWLVGLRAGMVGELAKGKYIQFLQDKKTGVISLVTEFEDPKLSYQMNLFVMEELNQTILLKLHFKAVENR